MNSNTANVVLDIGCGDCSRSAALTRTTDFFIGIDRYRPLLSVAKTKFVICSDASCLPIVSSSVDLAFSFSVIEHLGKISPFLRELHRVLKPNGLLFFETPNMLAIQNRLRLLLGNSFLDDSFGGYGKLDEFGHIRLFSPKELKRAVESNGFCVVEARGAGKLWFMYNEKLPLFNISGMIVLLAKKGRSLLIT